MATNLGVELEMFDRIQALTDAELFVLLQILTKEYKRRRNE